MTLKTLLCILLALQARMGMAICATHHVSVYPRHPDIATNSIFLLNYTENDFQLREKMKEVSFYAVAGKRQVKLQVEEVNFSGTGGQVLLRPARLFRPGDSVRLVVKLPASMDTFLRSRFLAQVEKKRWYVAFGADTRSPSWSTDSITFTYRAGNRFAGGRSFLFSCPVADDFSVKLTHLLYSDTQVPMLYEIRFRGETSMIISNNFTPEMNWSNCGSNFTFTAEKNLIVTIRPIDSSGNFGSPKTLAFTVPDN